MRINIPTIYKYLDMEIQRFGPVNQANDENMK